MPSTSVNEHCLKTLDKNLHRKQSVAVNEGSPNILRDPSKGKAPAAHMYLQQNSKKTKVSFMALSYSIISLHYYKNLFPFLFM